MRTYVMKMAGVCEIVMLRDQCGRFTHENLPTCLEIDESLFLS